MSIKDHGGQFGGGSSKKMFHKREELSLPVMKRKSLGYHAIGDANRYKDIYLLNVFNTNSSTVNLVSLDKDLNQIATADTWRSYATFIGSFTATVVSEKIGKVVSAYSVSGTYGLAIRNISESGVFSNEKYLTLGTYSTMAQTLVLDNDSDLLYCVWGNTLYCFDLKTLTNTSSPIWVATIVRPNKMIKVGNTLYSFASTESKAYTLTGSGVTLSGSSTAKADSGSEVLTDGTYIYTLHADGTIQCLDLNLNVIKSQTNSYLASMPSNKISRMYAHDTSNIGLLFVDDLNLYVRTKNTIIVLNKLTFDFVDERMFVYDAKDMSTTSSFTINEYRRTPFYDAKSGDAIVSVSQIVNNNNAITVLTQMLRLGVRY